MTRLRTNNGKLDLEVSLDTIDEDTASSCLAIAETYMHQNPNKILVMTSNPDGSTGLMFEDAIIPEEVNDNVDQIG